MTNQKDSNTIEIILFTILIVAIVISTINLFYNRSLWGDEAMLALNISQKSFLELLKPLEMNQVAPVGFLMTEKLFIILFGVHDWALRIYPFLSFLFSLILLFKINQKLFESKIISLISCVFFITNLSIFYYSNEVKQYSSDVLVSLLLIYTYISNADLKSKKEILFTSLVGAAAIFFSNTSIIILVTIAACVLNNFFKRTTSKNFNKFVPLLIWLFSFTFYFLFFIKDHPTKKFMVDYWSARKAFPTENIFSPEFRLFVFRKIKMLFSSFSEFGNTWIFFFALFLLGLYFIYKKEKRLIFLIAPLFIHFILSICKLYPFETRMLLYAIPIISTFISFGLFSIVNIISKRTNLKIGYIIPILPFVLLISLSFTCPVKKEEIKPCLQFANQHISNGEKLYVYYMANPAFQFYRNEYSTIGKSSSVVIGNWHIHGCGKSFLGLKLNNVQYIDNEELVRLKGRFWLLFTNVSESSYFKVNGFSEDQYIINSIIKRGGRILKNRLFIGSSCYQIEFNN